MYQAPILAAYYNNFYATYGCDLLTNNDEIKVIKL